MAPKSSVLPDEPSRIPIDGQGFAERSCTVERQQLALERSGLDRTRRRQLLKEAGSGADRPCKDSRKGHHAGETAVVGKRGARRHSGDRIPYKRPKTVIRASRGAAG